MIRVVLTLDLDMSRGTMWRFHEPYPTKTSDVVPLVNLFNSAAARSAKRPCLGFLSSIDTWELKERKEKYG